MLLLPVARLAVLSASDSCLAAGVGLQAALASVPFGIVLVRVRVRKPPPRFHSWHVALGATCDCAPWSLMLEAGDAACCLMCSTSEHIAHSSACSHCLAAIRDHRAASPKSKVLRDPETFLEHETGRTLRACKTFKNRLREKGSDKGRKSLQDRGWCTYFAVHTYKLT